jgi:hypothetical protein
LPESLVYVLWTLGVVVTVVVALWRTRKVFVSEVDERFKVAIQGEDFARVVDKKVVAAFEGATGPLMAGQRELAKDIGRIERAVDKAHKRIDEHLERHPE